MRVLVARDIALGRQVALSILRSDLDLPPDVRRAITDRLREQARSVAAVMNPSLTALFDVGEDDLVGLYLVCEFVDGPSLRERLVHGSMTPLEVAGMARALGTGLTQAHASGFVHRDIHPENILLSPAGPKLAGLGFAAPTDLFVPPHPTGAVLLSYCAPEVAALRSFGAKADQFSFAASLYEALTGRRAFEGEDVLEVANAVAHAKPPTVTTVASLRAYGALDSVFNRALAKRPDSRFPSCEAFGRALANELERPVVVTIPLPPSSRSSIVPRTTRRWQNAIALAAIAVIVTLAFVGRFAPSGVGEGVSLKVVSDEFATIAMTPSRTTGTPPGRRPPKLAGGANPGAPTPLPVQAQTPYDPADARSNANAPATPDSVDPRAEPRASPSTDPRY